MKKYGFHSGIVFHDNVKKHIVVKPFSFDIKNKEMKLQNSEPEKKVEVGNLELIILTNDMKKLYQMAISYYLTMVAI